MRLNEIVENTTLDFIVLVGLPGSGKSTYITQLQKRKSYVVISTDDIFEELAAEVGVNYTVAFKTFPYKDVEREMFVRLKQALSQKKNIIVDQTNMTTKSRARKLSLVPPSYKKVAVVFEVDPDELERRLSKRKDETGKSIPKNVVDSMRVSYQRPSKTEGFDELIDV
jgi:predicted kinase